MIYFHHPLFLILLVPLCLIILYYLKLRNILIAGSRIAITSLILLAIASPYTVVERPGIEGSTDITIIADSTESMRLFNSSVKDEVYGYLSNRTHTGLDLISGNTSPIGDRIIRNIKSGGNILLISDGNNNHGRSLPDAINFAGSLNTTVYLLKQEPIKKDMSISISGDSVAIPGTPADFHINVKNTGALEGDLEVQLDGTAVYSGHVMRSMDIPLAYTFNTTGSHTIRAEIFAGKEDEFSQNNVFYRSVHVVPRPDLLLVSKESSPLSSILSQLYSVEISPALKDPGSFDAVVLDDTGAGELSKTDAAHLSDYVAGGGGLLVVGGANAYTDYSRAPLLEQLLPVRAGGAPHAGKSAGVVLVVDISGSTGELLGTDQKLGIEKGLAIQMLNSIGSDDFLGIIAFNNAPHIIAPFARHPDRKDLEDTVSRLRHGGTTHLSPALEAAHDMIRNFDGGRNVIVISDGRVADGEASLRTAGSMADDGVSIYAIGVGGDTDEEFMKRLAVSGGYLSRDQAHGIELLFGEIKKKEKREGIPLLIINSGHFITRSTGLNATVSGYNPVSAKKNALTLVMTADGNPVITAWQFGLGRVVSITVDNGNEWAASLYDKENSKIISTSASYAVGRPRGAEIQADDGEIGSQIRIDVFSDQYPDLRFDGEKIQFSRTGEKLYTSTVIPNSTGFHDLSGYMIAVNEPSEFRELGNNELLPEFITASGGRVYDISEIKELIPDLVDKHTALLHESVDLKPLFLLAALLLYSIEVITRRLVDILR